MSTNEINLLIQNFKNDYINGSTTIAKNSLEILLYIWNVYKIYNIESIIDYIRILKNAKPTMAALQNILETLEHRLIRSNVSEEFPQICINLLEQINDATTKTTEKFNEFIENHIVKDDLIIITASYSSTVLQILNTIAKHTKLQVLAVESKWGHLDYSEFVVQKCNELAIRANRVAIDALFENNEHIDFTIIGADRIIQKEGVVNGVPSLSLAEFSNIKEIPFFVVGESFKIRSDIIIEEGFDFIPMHLIQRIFTDDVSFREKWESKRQ